MKQNERVHLIQTAENHALQKTWQGAPLGAIKPDPLPDLLRRLFVYPFGQPGHALEVLFTEVAQLMKMQGVAQENIGAGLIIFSVICSAKVRIPLSIVLRVAEDKAVAEHLLTACLKLVPKSLFVELHGLKPDDLFSAGDRYRNKVLVCRSFMGLKKIESELMSLIVNGHLSIQTTAKTKYGAQLFDLNVLGPVTFIGIETENEPRLFDNPQIIRISVSEVNADYNFDGSETGDNPEAVFEMDIVAKHISGALPRPVVFLHHDAFSAAIRKQQPLHYIHKKRFALKLLEILTILNHLGAPDFEGFLARAMDSKPEHVRSWSKKNGLHMESQPPDHKELIVDKKEYFIAAKLLNELLPVNYPILSPLRRQLFEVIKDINLTKLGAALISHHDILEQLYTMAHSDIYWARLKEIYLKINHDINNIISEKGIAKELAALIKIGMIERKNFKDSDGHGYYITTGTVNKAISFPSLGELFGDCDNDALKEVVDPVTGSVEMI